jgi:tetratricopeptide (TPR) repeat protein
MTVSATDAHGNLVSGPPEAGELFDFAVDRLLRYHPDVVRATRSLTTGTPDFAMAHALSAYLALSSTDAPDLPAARTAADELRRVERNDREDAHLRVISSWLSGDWHGASRGLDDLLIRWPADLTALLVGHQLDFYLGDARNLRDRVGRSRHAIDPKHPHYGFISGMQAFGLEESGQYELSEARGMSALETNPDDVWAVHAVVHTYEMRGMVDDGIRFLHSREPDWTTDNFFTVHNWWHLALYLLEAERRDEALDIYDEQIHNAASACVPLEMLDASALLWRLFLDDADTGGRFGPLADAWAARTTEQPWYVFNDLHAVMAFAGAGRIDDARAVITRLDGYVATAPDPAVSNVWMTAEVGLPACRAVLAFAEGRDNDVLHELLPIRRAFARIGGSHAQRDALQRTALRSAIRSGRLDLAEALTSERLAVRETSVYSLRRWADVLRRDGDLAAAERADTSADAQRDRFAAAAAEVRPTGS